MGTTRLLDEPRVPGARAERPTPPDRGLPLAADERVSARREAPRPNAERLLMARLADWVLGRLAVGSA